MGRSGSRLRHDLFWIDDGAVRWLQLRMYHSQDTHHTCHILNDRQILDSYNAISGDCFVAIVCLRAIVSFSWTFFVGTWSAESGPAMPFGIFGMLMAIFSLLLIPFLLYGKRMRIATADWLPAEAEH